MRLYAWAGQQAAALRQYHECTRILGAELGAVPEEETTALYEAIRTRQLGWDATALPSVEPATAHRLPRAEQVGSPPIPAQRDDGHSHTLPAHAEGSLFVARQRELRWLDGLLDAALEEQHYGLSDWAVAEFSIDAWVGDLETVANQFGTERFVLLGVSQGASVAQDLRVQPILDHIGRAPLAGDHSVAAQVPPEIVGQLLWPTFPLPRALDFETSVVEQEDAARPVAIRRADGVDVDRVGAAVDSVGIVNV